MLGFVAATQRGEGDRLVTLVAARLQSAGVAVAGVVQINTASAPDCACQMDLRFLHDGSTIRISQSLGPLSSGCRLDPSGLEMAVARVEAAIETARPRLVILNKFGKQEVDGRGFRPLIGKALALGIPVLTTVAVKNRAGFDAFAEDMAEALPACETEILNWCHRQMAVAQTLEP